MRALAQEHTHTNIHAEKHAYMHSRTHTGMQARRETHTHILARKHDCPHTRTQAHASTHRNACMRARTHACTHARTHVEQAMQLNERWNDLLRLKSDDTVLKYTMPCLCTLSHSDVHVLGTHMHIDAHARTLVRRCTRTHIHVRACAHAHSLAGTQARTLHISVAT